MPYSIQVHQNHPEASLEAGASDVLSDCGWLVKLNILYHFKDGGME